MKKECSRNKPYPQESTVSINKQCLLIGGGEKEREGGEREKESKIMKMEGENFESSSSNGQMKALNKYKIQILRESQNLRGPLLF